MTGFFKIHPETAAIKQGLFVIVGAALTAAMVLYPTLAILLVAVAVSILVLWALASVLQGKTESIMKLWVLVFPLGYFFVAFPRQKSIITFDRFVIGLLLVGVIFAGRHALAPIQKDLSQAAAAWSAFAVIAGITLFRALEPMVSVRWYVDGFVFPAVLGWFVVTCFPVRRHLLALHTFTCIMTVYVTIIGMVEFFSRTSVIPLPGSAPLVYAGRFARPHGPFYNDDSFALIGMISLFFILFLRHALQDRWSGGRNLLHWVGVVCAVLQSLMPLFRSVGITFLLILLLENFFEKRVTKRLARIALIILFIGSVFGAATLVPDAYSDRSNPDNFYVRIAEQKQFIALFLDHPLFGVGIINFHAFVENNSRYMTQYHGVTSIDFPHSNMGGILSETGIVGLIPYVLAQFLLLRAFFRLSKKRNEMDLWKSALYIFLSYSVSGLTLASGYNSDLNMWFMFTLMALYKYATTAEKPESSGSYARQTVFATREPEFASALR